MSAKDPASEMVPGNYSQKQDFIALITTFLALFTSWFTKEISVLISLLLVQKHREEKGLDKVYSS